MKELNKKEHAELVAELAKLDPLSDEFREKVKVLQDDQSYRQAHEVKPITKDTILKIDNPREKLATVNYAKKADAITENTVDRLAKTKSEQAEKDKQQQDASLTTKQKAMKTIHQLLNNPLPLVDIASYDLTVRDAKDLMNVIKVVHPENEHAITFTSELDDDLAKLYHSKENEYAKTIKDGQKILHDFDKAAKAHGVKVPKREIDNLAPVSMPEKIKEGLVSTVKQTINSDKHTVKAKAKIVNKQAQVDNRTKWQVNQQTKPIMTEHAWKLQDQKSVDMPEQAEELSVQNELKKKHLDEDSQRGKNNQHVQQTQLDLD